MGETVAEAVAKVARRRRSRSSSSSSSTSTSTSRSRSRSRIRSSSSSSSTSSSSSSSSFSHPHGTPMTAPTAVLVAVAVAVVVVVAEVVVVVVAVAVVQCAGKRGPICDQERAIHLANRGRLCFFVGGGGGGGCKIAWKAWFQNRLHHWKVQHLHHLGGPILLILPVQVVQDWQDWHPRLAKFLLPNSVLRFLAQSSSSSSSSSSSHSVALCLQRVWRTVLFGLGPTAAALQQIRLVWYVYHGVPHKCFRGTARPQVSATSCKAS